MTVVVLDDAAADPNRTTKSTKDTKEKEILLIESKRTYATTMRLSEFL
jgi:hypothetical protein